MNINELIKTEGAVVTDGSMGSYLEKLGYAGITPELASVEEPGLVASVHGEYVKSGASVIITNTFGANAKRLARKKLEGEIEAINGKSCEIAARARGGKDVLVAGDVGPSGELLEPYGSLTSGEAEEIFLRQADMLKKGGVDFILLETFQDLKEIDLAYNIIREKLDIFVLPSIALTSGGENRTLMGQKIEDLVKWAEDKDVFGVNCGVGSTEMKAVVRRIRELTGMPLWVKPNAGVPGVSGGKTFYPEEVEEFTSNCMEMVDAGVKFIGGCCGTTPVYIEQLKKKIDEKSRGRF